MNGTLAQILESGGIWSRMVFMGSLVWVIALLAVMFAQRKRLHSHARAILAAAPPDNITGDRFTAGLGPLTSGRVGLAMVSIWWFLAAAVLIWSFVSMPDITRLGDSAYLASLGPGTTPLMWPTNTRRR